MTGPDGTPEIGLRAGVPAKVFSVLAPAAAAGLVVARAASDGLSAGPDDPVSPWIVAIVTLGFGFWLGWRAPTQWARLRPDVLRCRNLVTHLTVDWDRVESLVVVRRGPLTMIEVRVRGHRRRIRIGAATRFSGESADAVIDMVRAHPVALSLLLDDGGSG